MTDDLVNRLREVGGMSDDGATRWYINPDGPEAADRIEKLERDILNYSSAVADAQMRNEELNRALNRIIDRWEKQSTRIEKLEAVLQNIAEGDVPRIVKIPFRDDGQPSKNDRCEHGQSFYEDCGCCIEDYARKALEGKDER